MAEVWRRSKDDGGGRESILNLSCDRLVCNNPHQVLMNIKFHQLFLLHACSKSLFNFSAFYYRFFYLYSSCFIKFLIAASSSHCWNIFQFTLSFVCAQFKFLLNASFYTVTTQFDSSLIVFYMS